MATHQGYAQKATISGVVKDSITDEALPLIAVVLEGTSFGVNTNLDGEFLFVVPHGDYKLSVRYSGYDLYEDSLHIAGDTSGMTIYLQPVSMNLEGLVITSRDVNPSHRVMRNAINNRRKNKFDKIDAYEYQSYNKLVITMDNVTD
ncbi:MAG: carboxypeptidase-like regulatory domain-containing protein, partial [Bacteroidota bacterium]